MPLDLPNLDDRTYDDLVTEAIGLIPIYAPKWTNHNASDPGITLIELFAYLTEMLLYRQNRVTDANIEAFLRLLAPEWQPSGDLQADIRRSVLNLRERHRAVTCEDFETIAVGLAGVARAHCLPQTNLESGDRELAPGHVSLVIVPDDDSESVPQPSEALIQTVIEDFQDRLLLTTRLHVVKPHYVRVAVQVRLVLRRDAKPELVKQAASKALKQFFHPLPVGSNQQGWPFGRSIYVSEIYNLLDRLPGVDYVTKFEENDELYVIPDEGEDSSTERYVRADDSSLIAVALKPYELIDIQIDLNNIHAVTAFKDIHVLIRS